MVSLGDYLQLDLKSSPPAYNSVLIEVPWCMCDFISTFFSGEKIQMQGLMHQKAGFLAKVSELLMNLRNCDP